MESLRNFLKSWPGRIFLILCLSPLALFGIEGVVGGGGADPNVVATVGEQHITRDQYQSTLNARRNELTPRIDASMINETVLRDQVLAQLIDATLLEQQTRKLGMFVSDERINNMLLQEPSFQDETGKFSGERFAFFLQQRRISKPQLFDEIRNQLSFGQLSNTILKTAVYPMKSIDELIDLQEETRHVWVHRLPWQDYVIQGSLSSEEVEAYYNEHRGDLNSKAMVDLSYMLLSPETLEVPPVTEDDILVQYEDFKRRASQVESRRISQILLTGADAQAKATKVQEQLKAGQPFEELSKTYSDDVVTGSSGGDIGTFNPDVFGEDGSAVKQALEGLNVGEVTEPVKTAYGYQIFKVTADDSEGIPSLEQVREQLEEAAKRYKRDMLLTDKITFINEMAVDGVSMEDIARQEGLTVKSIKDYTKVDNQTLLNQPAIISAAFNESNIQDESVSTNIDVEELTVWVQPHNYRPIAPLTLAEATPQIEDILRKQKAIAAAYAQAQTLADKVSSLGMEAVEAQFNDLGPITRLNNVLTDVESSAVFSQEIDSTQRVAKAYKIEGGASVLVMDPITKQPDESMPENIRVKTASLIRDNKGQEQLEDYLDFLRSTNEIVRNEAVIEELGDI